MVDNTAYPGNPALPKEVRDKILSTFRHSLNLYRAGKSTDSAVGCEFILKMDPRFDPAKRLLEAARNPAAGIDLADLDRLAADDSPPAPNPGSEAPDRMLISAIEAYAERNFDKAIECANRVLEALPTNNDAREILEKAKRKKDLRPHVENFRQRALFALESGQIEEARLNFERMRSLDPEHPDVEKLSARVEASGAPGPAPAPNPPAGIADLRFDLNEPAAPPVEPFRPSAAWSPIEASPATPGPAPTMGMEGLDLGPPSESPPLSEWAPIGESPSAPQPNFADLWGPAEAPAAIGGAPEAPAAGSEEIARLLREGDEMAARDPQGAIEAWSRIFLLDLGNADATSRIEDARSRLADTNRRVADALKAGRSLYDGGQLKDAREKFLEVLAIDENEPTARSFLQRIEDDFSRPQGSYDLSLTSPRGDVLAEEEMSSKDAPASFASAERSERTPTATKRRSSWIPLAAAAGLVAAIAIGLYFVLRPSPQARPVEAARPAPGRTAERPAAPEPQVGSGTGSASIPIPKAPPAGADAKRAEAEAALAGHRYIAALTAFNLCAPAYANDPGFRQEMGHAAERVSEISPAVKLYNDGDYETALPLLWRLYQADHQNEDVKSYLVRAYYDLGVIDLQNNLFDKASRAFAEALSVDPNDVLTRRQKAFADRYLRNSPDLLAKIYVKYLRPRP